MEFFLYWCGFFFINNKYTFVVAVRVLYDLRQVLFLLFSFCAFCGGDSERLIKLGERERARYTTQHYIKPKVNIKHLQLMFVCCVFEFGQNL